MTIQNKVKGNISSELKQWISARLKFRDIAYTRWNKEWMTMFSAAMASAVADAEWNVNDIQVNKKDDPKNWAGHLAALKEIEPEMMDVSEKLIEEEARADQVVATRAPGSSRD